MSSERVVNAFLHTSEYVVLKKAAIPVFLRNYDMFVAFKPLSFNVMPCLYFAVHEGMSVRFLHITFLRQTASSVEASMIASVFHQ